MIPPEHVICGDRVGGRIYILSRDVPTMTSWTMSPQWNVCEWTDKPQSHPENWRSSLQDPGMGYLHLLCPIRLSFWEVFFTSLPGNSVRTRDWQEERGDGLFGVRDGVRLLIPSTLSCLHNKVTFWDVPLHSCRLFVKGTVGQNVYSFQLGNDPRKIGRLFSRRNLSHRTWF